MRKIIGLIIIALILNAYMLNQPCFSEAKFKDTSQEVKETIKHFEDKAVLKEFIGKYGEEYFRPTSTVTREDLIMALREYDEIVKALIEYRRMLSQKIRELSREVSRLKKEYQNKQPSEVDEDTVTKVIDETQKILPTLIKNTPMSKKIEEELILMREEINMLRKPSIKTTNAMIKKVIRETYPQIEEEAETQKEIENKISLLQNKLDLLSRKYSSASDKANDSARYRDIVKKVTQLEKNIKTLESRTSPIGKKTKSAQREPYEQEKIENEIEQLKKEIRKWAKLYRNLPARNGTDENYSNQDKAMVKKIENLESSIKRLEFKVASSNRETKKINISGSYKNKSNKDSTLTKVSLGISLIALLFMAR